MDAQGDFVWAVSGNIDSGEVRRNPGAAGKSGWHKVRTLVKLTIDGYDMRDCEVIELA